MDPERFDVFKPHLDKGFAKAGGGKSLAAFDVAPFVSVVLGDDLERCRMPVKGMLALYIGGMGARSKNFYNDYAKRLGYEAEVVKIQDLYLDGKKAEAMAAVPARRPSRRTSSSPRNRSTTTRTSRSHETSSSSSARWAICEPRISGESPPRRAVRRDPGGR